MLTSYLERRQEARRRAEEKFIKARQREDDAQNERQKAFAAVAAKTARLRALRLAKESNDRNAADQASADAAKLKATRLAKNGGGAHVQN